MRAFLRRALTPAFVRAVKASGYTQVTLAAECGFAANTQLSDYLNGPDVAFTAFNRARFQALADFIEYDGRVFEGVDRE